jgi:exopolysaccharide biosynthesis polyprenyl glycosylphosphotransferase
MIRSSTGFSPEQFTCPAPTISGARVSCSVAKRVMDAGLAAFLLLFLLPLLLLVAVLIRLDSAGPVLFRQRRTGLQGKAFFIYKFRTMHVMEDGAQVKQACADDPRVTRIGRMLRKSSIDELPQIFNVLKGQMSLVGPRPHALAHDYYYGSIVPSYYRRFEATPGITGLAQVRGLRGETRTTDCMAARVESDLEYIRDWSLAMDLQILLRSALIVFRGSGV